MKTKIVKEKEQKTVLSKKNYIILISSSILIIAVFSFKPLHNNF